MRDIFFGSPTDFAHDGMMMIQLGCDNPRPLRSAESLWNGLLQRLPGMKRQKESAHWVALAPGCDHHKANKRLIAHLVKDTDDSVFVLPGFCKQHATGLCLAPLSTSLGLLSPCFCLVKQLHQGTTFDKFLRIVHTLIDNNLVVKGPSWRPNDAHRKHAEALLELTLYSYDLHEMASDDLEKQRLVEKDRSLRLQGQRLLECCPGDWSQPEIVYWDCEGCNSRAQFVVEVFDAICGPIVHCIPTPAKNKWTQVTPVIMDFALGTNFHCIFQQAWSILRSSRDRRQEPQNDDDSMSSDAQIGIPTDAMTTNRKIEHKRGTLGERFMDDPLTKARLLLFLVIARPVMSLHLMLFRDATTPAEPEIRAPIFNMCDMRKSPAMKCVSSLSKLFFHSHSDWHLITVAIGSEEWPEQFELQVVSNLLSMIGSVWRRLIVSFEVWPWR